MRHVDPDYPELARAAGIEGVVILEAIIDLRGRVQNVTVLRSIPFLDEAAIAAVERWEYEPTLLNGIPVPVVMTVTVRFVSERRR
jgi:protein TonB